MHQTERRFSNMATFSSKQEKKQGLGTSVSVLLSVALIGAFVVLGPLNASLSNSISGVLGTWSSADNVYNNAEVASFAVDQSYWDANCSYGWTSNATCDGIFSRVQSCVINVATPYCSSYENYMQDFFTQ
jgi:hypothetical protein